MKYIGVLFHFNFFTLQSNNITVICFAAFKNNIIKGNFKMKNILPGRLKKQMV